jgi:hypothetical protein
VHVSNNAYAAKSVLNMQQTFTQIHILKYVNNAFVLQQQAEHEHYDADDVYDAHSAQLFAAAIVSDTQVELDLNDLDVLDNEVFLFSDDTCKHMYNNVLTVYYMHTSNGYSFYVNTQALVAQQLQAVVQQLQAVA